MDHQGERGGPSRAVREPRNGGRHTRIGQHCAALCLAVLGALWSVNGVCSPPPQDTQTPGTGTPPYQVVTDLHQIMDWIVYPAADVIWDSAGTIITAQGSQELAPTSNAGWLKVMRAAATLAESGNLLMLPGRAAGADWINYSSQLVAEGKLAMAAAGAQDADALFDAGGRIYQVCQGCHNQYWVEADGTR